MAILTPLTPMTTYTIALPADAARLARRFLPSSSRWPKPASSSCQSASRNIPMRDDPDQHPAERLLGELAQGAAAGRDARAVAEGELDREPADEHVDDAVRDQAGAGDPVDPVALVYLAGASVGAHERSPSAVSMARWKVG